MTACPRCASTLVYRNEDSEPECLLCGTIHHQRPADQTYRPPAAHYTDDQREVWRRGAAKRRGKAVA